MQISEQKIWFYISEMNENVKFAGLQTALANTSVSTWIGDKSSFFEDEALKPLKKKPWSLQNSIL